MRFRLNTTLTTGTKHKHYQNCAEHAHRLKRFESRSRPTTSPTVKSRMPAVAICAVPPVPPLAAEEGAGPLPDGLRDWVHAQPRGGRAKRKRRRLVANGGGCGAFRVRRIDRVPEAFGDCACTPRNEGISEAGAWMQGCASAQQRAPACRSRGPCVCGRALAHLVARFVEG